MHYIGQACLPQHNEGLTHVLRILGLHDRALTELDIIDFTELDERERITEGPACPLHDLPAHVGIHKRKREHVHDGPKGEEMPFRLTGKVIEDHALPEAGA